VRMASRYSKRPAADIVITVRSPALTFQAQDRDGILSMPLLRVEREH
jgi:hypothetical protein